VNRRLVRIALTSASALSLTACTGPAPNAAAPKPVHTKGQAVTLTWAAPPLAGSGARQQLIRMFEKTHPHTRVRLVTQTSDWQTDASTLQAQLSRGAKAPDVFTGPSTWAGNFALRDLAEPLARHMPAGYFMGFASGLTADTTVHGHVYGAPLTEDPTVLYYRKDLLGNSHLAVPGTWEQLQHEATVVSRRAQGVQGFVWAGSPASSLTRTWVEFLADAGGRVYSSSGAPDMDSAAGVRALTFLRSLITSGVSPGGVLTQTSTGAIASMRAGQAIFLAAPVSAWPRLQAAGASKVMGRIGVAPLPTFAGRPQPGFSTTGAMDLYLNPHSAHIRQASELIQFLTGTAAMRELAMRYGQGPTLVAVQRLPAIARLNPAYATLPAVRLLSLPSQTPNYAQVEASIATRIRAALSGQASVASSLSAANASLAAARRS